MTIHLALIRSPGSEQLDSLTPVLRDMVPQVAFTVVDAAPGARLQTFRRLLTVRPHIVVVEAGAPQPLAANLYRMVAPQSRLVLFADKAKPHRTRTRRVDAVIVEPNDIVRVVEDFRPSLARPSTTGAELGSFGSFPPFRGPDSAYRLLYAGDLSASSSAPDVLIALAAWAEANPGRTAEIWWAADGDLSGVLAAQPLPPNLTQQFHGSVARIDLPGLMSRCGILVVEKDATNGTAPILEAWAAGLVVIASRRVLTARVLLDGDSPGWLFDPARPDGFADALEQVLSAEPAVLDGLRLQGQRLAGGLTVQNITGPKLANLFGRTPILRRSAVTP